MNRYAAANQVPNRSSSFSPSPPLNAARLYYMTEDAVLPEPFSNVSHSPACPVIWTVVGQPPSATVTTPCLAVLDYFARARRAPFEWRSEQSGRSANENSTLFMTCLRLSGANVCKDSKQAQKLSASPNKHWRK